jgi:hypothetical protein
MLNTVTLPIGETITLTYSPCNSMLPSTIGDTLFSYSYSEDCKSGLLSSVIDPNSNVWTYTYNDPMFRLTNFATPLTTASYTDSNTYTYTPTSFDSKMTFNGGNSVYESLYTADTLGRIVLTQQGYNSTQYTTVQVGYNTDGLQTTQSEPFLSAAGTKGTGLTNATFTYDSLARPIKIVGTNGQTQTIAYNGRDILTTMGGYITQTEVNGLGWVTSVCEVTSIAGSGPCGQDNAQTGFLTTYTYNADGRVMQVVHNANTTSPLHRMSRQNRNPVIGFLGNRYTFIAERLEGFGRELRPLQFLQQQHIQFANFQPRRDMGQPRANRIQIPTSDFKHQSTF